MSCGGEWSRAIELIGGAGLCDEGDFRLVVRASEGDGDGFDRLGGVIGCAGVIDGDDVEGEGEGFALAKEVEVLSGGVLPAVLITADRGNGEGVRGQCVDLPSELGSEIEDVGAIGPFDVAVVSGSDGDGVVGIEVVPGDRVLWRE